MTRYTEWEQYEPRAIRKALPLEWAVGFLFDAWDAGAAMMPCPLPGHQDDTPSFNLWAEDEDGFPIRYGCFGCGANGDVVDLIRESHNVGFLEACRIAVEELIPEMQTSNWRPSDRNPVPARTPKSHDELAAVLARIRGYDDLEEFLARKGMAEVSIDFAAMRWGWGTFRTPAPTAYFPHRDWDGRLTGIRYRSVRRDGTRWTERGSRFPALYGAWLDLGRPSAVLCEGETDTVWASFQLEQVTKQFDVLGLPAGTAQKPNVTGLHGRDVYLAFDGDMAGRFATARWREALEGVAAKTFIVPIRDGEDLLSCGVPVADLIEDAR